MSEEGSAPVQVLDYDIGKILRFLKKTRSAQEFKSQRKNSDALLVRTGNPAGNRYYPRSKFQASIFSKSDINRSSLSNGTGGNGGG